MDFNKLHIGDSWDRFEEFRLKKFRGLSTGFPEVDKAIVAMPGCVVVLGEPGCGKSTFVLNILAHNARQGIPTILFDKENGLQRTRLRLLCYLGDLSTGAIESGKFRGAEEARYNAAVEELQSLPIFYLETIEPSGFEQLIREIGKAYKQRVFVVVDSINRLCTDMSDGRRGNIDAWMSLFNDMKLKFDNYLTIMIVSEKAKAQYGKASSAGAKESGTIEYLGEVILDLYPTKDKQATIVECTKNRDGRKGVITTLMPTEPFTYKINDTQYLGD